MGMWVGVDWIDLAQDADKWQAVMIINIRVA
jgi:hypothetical protein